MLQLLPVLSVTAAGIGCLSGCLLGSLLGSEHQQQAAGGHLHCQRGLGSQVHRRTWQT